MTSDEIKAAFDRIQEAYCHPGSVDDGEFLTCLTHLDRHIKHLETIIGETEIDLLEFLNELDGVASGMASEAMEESEIRANVKGWRFFFVERAQAHVGLAPAFQAGNIVAN